MCVRLSIYVTLSSPFGRRHFFTITVERLFVAVVNAKIRSFSFVEAIKNRGFNYVEPIEKL